MNIARTACLATLLVASGCATEPNGQNLKMVSADAKTIRASTPVFSQRVVHSLPRGWMPAFERTVDGRYIMEFLPRGQTVHAWQEMITLQGFRNLALAPVGNPQRVLEVMVDGYRKNCPKSMIAKMLGERRIDGHLAHAAVLGCLASPGDQSFGLRAGQGEIAYFIAIQGSRDVYLIHRAVRFAGGTPAEPMIEKVTKGMEDVMPVWLCPVEMPQTTCWERGEPKDRPQQRPVMPGTEISFLTGIP